jgi:hypothetical protein
LSAQRNRPLHDVEHLARHRYGRFGSRPIDLRKLAPGIVKRERPLDALELGECEFERVRRHPLFCVRDDLDRRPHQVLNAAKLRHR